MVFFWLIIYFVPVVVIYKRINFCCFLRTLFDFLWFNVTVIANWKHLLSFLLMGFIAALGESIHMMHHDLYLFHDVDDTIDEHNQICLWYLWYLLLSESKNFLIASSASSFIMVSMLSLFECIICCWSLSNGEIKLIAIFSWVFIVSEFLTLLMMLLNMAQFYQDIL